jgi:hypothetical protein
MLMLKLLAKVKVKKTKHEVPLLVTVGVTRVPFSLTWIAPQEETAETGIVTLAKPVVPLTPVAVKLMELEEPTMLERVASLRMEAEQPVPQPVVDVDATLKVTMAE